jgi:hypothetical protein
MALRLFSGLACVGLLACGGSAELEPRDDVVTSVRTTAAGDLLRATELTLRRPDGERTYAVGELLNVEVTGFLSSRIEFNRSLATAPSLPVSGQRAALLEDDAINTGLDNPGRQRGLSFRFVTAGGIASSISNRAGPDLFVLELGLEGGVRGDGGFGALPGDAFTVRGLGQASDRSADILSNAYVRLGEARVPSVERFSNVGPDEAASPVSSLEELEQVSLQSLGTTDLELYAVALDLDDLGFEEGESVQGLEILRFDSLQSPDPCLILGIPDTLSR